ncbi:hypothetical protein [Thalassoroseus pseudoceratinae]|uniref:hypothetical protein n=1 Tax=Thalassoroseus pseudoceratinae TaxID=2713176 RepID=UPI0014202143|nr:hypothetical protein [Thalassoroseus pseudoceratinae]
MLKQLLNDEAGFIVSAELVMIATILVIGLVVGLSEVAHAVNSELNDVGEAIGCLNQSYGYTGFSKAKDDGNGGIFGNNAAVSFGCVFVDSLDDCDNNECDIACGPVAPEVPKNN